MNTKPESLKFDKVKDRWNNFTKIVCEIADDVLGKKVKNTAGRIIANIKMIYV